MRFVILLLLSSICHVVADIPDNVLDSGIYEVTEHAGDDFLIDVIFSEADSVTSCFGYTVSSGGIKKYWVLDLDYSGAVLYRQQISVQPGDSEYWIRGVFLEPELLLIIQGELQPGSSPHLSLIDLLDPENSSTSPVPFELGSDESLIIRALKSSSEEWVTVAGTRWLPGSGACLFVCRLEHDGSILWETSVAENPETQFIHVILENLSDGGCVLSYEYDWDPPPFIPLCRLGSDGSILWQKSLPVDDRFLASLSDFQELDDGSILCTGTLDHLGRYLTSKGFSACLDSQGEELWRRTDWYGDNTSFRSSAFTTQDGTLIAGFISMRHGDGCQPQLDFNILLATMADDGSRITGTELFAEGDQIIHSVFVTESGQIIVTGTDTQPGKEEANIFFRRLDITELR